MNECEYCGEITYMPHQCKFCDKMHCGEHILPENHNCNGYGFNNGKPIPACHAYIKDW